MKRKEEKKEAHANEAKWAIINKLVILPVGGFLRNRKEYRTQLRKVRRSREREIGASTRSAQIKVSCAARRRRGSPQASLLKTWANKKPCCLVGFLGYWCGMMYYEAQPEFKGKKKRPSSSSMSVM